MISALLAVNAYYHTAFKKGAYPAITCDKIYLQARPHINTAVATADTAGAPPTLGQNGAAGSWTAATNNFFALVFATSAGTVVMKSGSSSKTFSVPAGITVLTAPLTTGSGMTATLSRGGTTYVDFTPSFTFAGEFFSFPSRAKTSFLFGLRFLPLTFFLFPFDFFSTIATTREYIYNHQFFSSS